MDYSIDSFDRAILAIILLISSKGKGKILSTSKAELNPFQNPFYMGISIGTLALLSKCFRQ